MNVQYRRLDGSFVAELNGLPYHVTAEEPALYAMALQHGLSAPFEPVPPTPTPEEALAAWRATAEVSRFQAFAALYAIDKLDDAAAAVEAAGGLTVLAWQNAQVFKRSSPMLAALAPALGLDDEALDELFLAAAEITA
jgi:hypothetical protein